MSARYMKLPTSDQYDDIRLDFSSSFDYNKGANQNTPFNNENYRSAFTFSNSPAYNAYTENIQFTRGKVKQPLIGRICHLFLTACCMLLLILTFPISGWFCFRKLGEYERIAIFRLGRLVEIKGPGIAFILPCVDNCRKVDMKIKAFKVPPQQIISSDGGVVEAGADVFYKIVDAEKFVLSLQDLDSPLRTLVMASLKNNFVRRDVDDMLTNKLIIAAEIKEDTNSTTSGWGVEAVKVEIPLIKILHAPEPKNPLAGLGLGGDLPNTFQQLATMFMQSAKDSSAKTPNEEPGATAAPATLPTVMALSPDGAAGSVEGAPNPREIIRVARGLINETTVRQNGCLYLFQLDGENGGLFYLDLKNGNGGAGEGLPSTEPDVTLTLSVSDMQNMFMGNIKPLQVYMSGRLKVSGDLSAAINIEDFVKRVVDKMKYDSRENDGRLQYV
ncbi:stomatin-like protein 1 isoform X1 [Crassostrea angulata]|uniref:stomatin-like protein 1 isoform X1 n=1 Tax=Magallana angulata TaxID=2784310 RepID=UPI0022B0D4E7|nr:stomatin-like protein 1 isoform X1 [Crassostrea angulata]XP_052710288.1 stomatin-like protein 1 isoform X1 [Crassostrea angulata]